MSLLEDDKLRSVLSKVNINASRDIKTASALCEEYAAEHEKIGTCIKELLESSKEEANKRAGLLCVVHEVVMHIAVPDRRKAWSNVLVEIAPKCFAAQPVVTREKMRKMLKYWAKLHVISADQVEQFRGLLEQNSEESSAGGMLRLIQPSSSVNHTPITSTWSSNAQIDHITNIICVTNRIVTMLENLLASSSSPAAGPLHQTGPVPPAAPKSPEVMVFNATVYWLVNFVFRCMVTPKHDAITVVMACVLIAGKSEYFFHRIDKLLSVCESVTSKRVSSAALRSTEAEVLRHLDFNMTRVAVPLKNLYTWRTHQMICPQLADSAIHMLRQQKYHTHCVPLTHRQSVVAVVFLLIAIYNKCKCSNAAPQHQLIRFDEDSKNPLLKIEEMDDAMFEYCHSIAQHYIIASKIFEYRHSIRFIWPTARSYCQWRQMFIDPPMPAPPVPPPPPATSPPQSRDKMSATAPIYLPYATISPSSYTYSEGIGVAAAFSPLQDTETNSNDQMDNSGYFSDVTDVLTTPYNLSTPAMSTPHSSVVHTTDDDREDGEVMDDEETMACKDGECVSVTSVSDEAPSFIRRMSPRYDPRLRSTTEKSTDGASMKTDECGIDYSDEVKANVVSTDSENTSNKSSALRDEGEAISAGAKRTVSYTDGTGAGVADFDASDTKRARVLSNENEDLPGELSFREVLRINDNGVGEVKFEGDDHVMLAISAPVAANTNVSCPSTENATPRVEGIGQGRASTPQISDAIESCMQPLHSASDVTGDCRRRGRPLSREETLDAVIERNAVPKEASVSHVTLSSPATSMPAISDASVTKKCRGRPRKSPKVDPSLKAVEIALVRDESAENRKSVMGSDVAHATPRSSRRLTRTNPMDTEFVELPAVKRRKSVPPDKPIVSVNASMSSSATSDAQNNKSDETPPISSSELAPLDVTPDLRAADSIGASSGVISAESLIVSEATDSPARDLPCPGHNVESVVFSDTRCKLTHSEPQRALKETANLSPAETQQIEGTQGNPCFSSVCAMETLNHCGISCAVVPIKALVVSGSSEAETSKYADAEHQPVLVPSVSMKEAPKKIINLASVVARQPDDVQRAARPSPSCAARAAAHCSLQIIAASPQDSSASKTTPRDARRKSRDDTSTDIGRQVQRTSPRVNSISTPTPSPRTLTPWVTNLARTNSNDKNFTQKHRSSIKSSDVNIGMSSRLFGAAMRDLKKSSDPQNGSH